MIASITILDESTSLVHARALANKLKLDIHYADNIKYVDEDVVAYIGSFGFGDNLENSLLEIRSSHCYVHLVISVKALPRVQKTMIIDFTQYPEAFL
jgi:hypothetical protein